MRRSVINKARRVPRLPSTATSDIVYIPAGDDAQAEHLAFLLMEGLVAPANGMDHVYRLTEPGHALLSHLEMIMDRLVVEPPRGLPVNSHEASPVSSPWSTQQ